MRTLLAVVSFCPTFVVALEMQCDSLHWSEAPKIVNRQFVGTLSQVCEFYGESGGGFSELEKHINQTTVEEADEVLEGPTPITLEGLPGTYYDTWAEVDSSLEMRGDNRIATDGSSRFLYQFESTEINGSGLKKYMRELKLHTEIRPINLNSQYKITIKSSQVVDKPLFLGSQTFLNQVKRIAVEQFEARRDNMVGDVAENL